MKILIDITKKDFIKKLCTFERFLKKYLESENDADFSLTEKEYETLDNVLDMLTDIQGYNW